MDNSQKLLTPFEGRLLFTIKINANELQGLKDIVNERASFKNQFICSV